MAETLHDSLELRLEALAKRIAGLRERLSGATGAEKIKEFGELAELERRHRDLAQRLQALDKEPPEARAAKSGIIEKLAGDLGNAVDDFTDWVDSGHRSGRPLSGGFSP